MIYYIGMYVVAVIFTHTLTSIIVHLSHLQWLVCAAICDTALLKLLWTVIVALISSVIV